MPVARMAISATKSAATGRSQPGSTSDRKSACVLDMVDQNVAETKEFRLLSCYELIARSRQIDVDDISKAAGIGLEREHPVAEVDRLIQIMRHKQRRGAAVFDEAGDFVLQLLAGERIQRAERLVHQEDARLLRQATGDLYALLHPAGKLCGVF